MFTTATATLLVKGLQLICVTTPSSAMAWDFQGKHMAPTIKLVYSSKQGIKCTFYAHPLSKPKIKQHNTKLAGYINAVW
jgi:hypothetical protein